MCGDMKTTSVKHVVNIASILRVNVAIAHAKDKLTIARYGSMETAYYKLAASESITDWDVKLHWCVPHTISECHASWLLAQQRH